MELDLNETRGTTGRPEASFVGSPFAITTSHAEALQIPRTKDERRKHSMCLSEQQTDSLIHLTRSMAFFASEAEPALPLVWSVVVTKLSSDAAQAPSSAA